MHADPYLPIFERTQTIAIVGLSPKPERDSHHVAQYLQSQGFRIVPINPVAAASGMPILGEKVYATLTDAAQHTSIELVDIFRNSADVPPIIDEAIAMKAPAVWLQLGVVHDAATAKARAAGLLVVEDRCLMVDHRHAAAARG